MKGWKRLLALVLDSSLTASIRLADSQERSRARGEVWFHRQLVKRISQIEKLLSVGRSIIP